jgi:hypothetical protein
MHAHSAPISHSHDEFDDGSPAPISAAAAKAGVAKASAAQFDVTMPDGRKVTFSERTRMRKTIMIGEHNAVSVRMDFANGETRTISLPHDLLVKAAGHGLSTKMSDEVAGLKDIDDIVMEIESLKARIEAKNQWNSESRAGESSAGASNLAKAVAEVKNLPLAKVRDWLAQQDRASKLAMRKHAPISVVLARLEAEELERKRSRGLTAHSPIDAGILLDGLTS